MNALGISSESAQVLAAFGAYLLGVVALGFVSHRYLSRGSFVKNYFVGGRGLGAWVLALTVAATAVSGGTFMGFPSLIYTNGWVMALWIASYMVVPLTAMVLMGRRINQVARVAGSVTLPDVLRDRFRSPALGIAATLAILLFVSFNLIAQFKAGGLVLKEAMDLRPPPAEFAGGTAEPDGKLALSFRSDGRQETLRILPPHPDAVFVPEETVTDPENARVLAAFRLPDGKYATKAVRFPPSRVRMPLLGWRVETGYLVGLALFAVTVIAYTTFGGFWAVTMTDVFEGLVMLAGVLLMAVLAVAAVPTVTTDAGQTLTGLSAATEHLRQQDPALVSGPGPGNYLPVGLAFSFFLMWSLSSAGQPAGMVRMMSFKDTPSLRRAVVLVAAYYITTYLSLIVIFVCARAVFPTEYLKDVGTEGVPDSIMPAMARFVARPYSPFLAGFLLAAPYAAIMSTVAAFLLMISSSLVRDLYQRTISPGAAERTLRLASYAATALVGLVVVIGALNPPTFLQYVIVFTGTGQSCSFLFPVLLTLYWRRTTRQGALAGLLGGGLTVFALYVLGWIDRDPSKLDPFAPLYLGGLDPLVWGFAASLSLTVGVSLATSPDPELTARYFPD